MRGDNQYLDAPRLPFPPLQDWLELHVYGMNSPDRGGLHTVLSGRGVKSYYWSRDRGYFTPDAADKIAVELGVHPCVIWVDWFERAERECA